MVETKILVTGGLGFIGSHLVEALVDRGYRVHVLDNLSTGYRENLAAVPADKLQIFIGDVADATQVKKAMAGCDYVFHEAAIASVPLSLQDPAGTSRVNYGGTLNVLECARQLGVKRVVFAGSAAVYGAEPGLPKTEAMPVRPMTPYGVDKLASEFMGHVYSPNPEFVCLRYFNVFGIRQDPTSPYSGVISIFCDRMRQGIAPIIFGDGLQSRDFIHVSDVITANILVLEHAEAAGRTFNVGRGDATTLLELVESLNHITDQTLQPTFQPARAGDIQQSWADSRVLKALGWQPKMSIESGLKELI